MATANCPHCAATLNAAELDSGWCENCGKKVPTFIRAESVRSATITESSRLGTNEGAVSYAAEPPLPGEVTFKGAAAPPRNRKFLKMAVVLGAILAANAFLAWAFAGTVIWNVVMTIAGGLLAMFFAGVVSAALRGNRIEPLRTFGFFLYAVTVLGSGFLVSEWLARGSVYIDNSSPHEVVLDLDGKQWLQCLRGKNLTASLGKGTYALIVRALDGKELDRQQIRVDGRGDYILNVLNVQVYSQGTVAYGGFSFGNSSSEKQIQQPCFKVKVDYLFEEPPESISASVKRGQGPAFASRTYLRRGSPKKSPSPRR